MVMVVGVHLAPTHCQLAHLLPVLARLAMSGAVVPLIHLLLVLELLTVNTVPDTHQVQTQVRLRKHAAHVHHAAHVQLMYKW
jgi:hypothetical protein